MDLKIFNSILFGELQPYSGQNKEEKYFADKLKPSFVMPGNVEEFEEALNKALKDHPLLLEKEEYFINLNPEEGRIEIKSVRDEIFEPLIDIDIPPHFNATTEYYYYLIKNEGTRAVHELAKEIQSVGTEADGRFILQKILSQIEYLLSNTARELKALPNTDIPFYEPTHEESDTERIQMNTHFVFYTLQITLIRLYYEILSTFLALTDGMGKTESELYVHVLGKTPPRVTVEKVSKGLAIRRAQNIAEAQDFQETKANELINELHRFLPNDLNNIKLQIAITALENRLFIESQIENPTHHNFEELYSSHLADSILRTVKTQYKEQLEQYTYGHERMEILEELSDSIQLPSFTSTQKPNPLRNSIPRRLDRWFDSQKDLYKNHLTETFPTTHIGKGPHEVSQEPKAKKERSDFSTQKTTARKYLHFLSGNNPQQNKIMQENEYTRLLMYVDHLIETGNVPDNIRQIPQTGVSTGMIRYTFYLIHKELYTTRPIKDPWIDFLLAVFTQFKDSTHSTTKTKFSVKPSNYQHDMKDMTR